MIMTARVRVGWIEEPVAPAEVEAEAVRRKANSGLIEGMTREPHVSERTCIVTRQSGAPEAMIRFVRGPDGVAHAGHQGAAAGPRRLGDGARRRRRARRRKSVCSRAR